MTTKETRVRRSEEEWRALILQYESAETITADFFTHIGVVSSMIYKHRKRFKLKHPRGDPRNIAKLQPPSPGTELVVAGERKLSSRNHPPEVRQKAIALYEQGVTKYAEIADRIGIPGKAAAVAYWITAHRKGGGKRASKQQFIPAERGNPAPVHGEPAMGAGTKAAIILLKQMDREINRMIRANKIQTPDSAHLYGQLALRALTGDQ